MESVFVDVYCDGDLLSSSKGVLFECLCGPKVVTLSEDMSLDALRKIIMDAIRKFGCKGPIELNATFGQSPNGIPTLLLKQRKPISANEIIVLVHDQSM
ncbi:hypothetical protein GmHk_02G004645 [Glycine max]|nr:hypothetical protein GmHk_02G004645 [Glycine max]